MGNPPQRKNKTMPMSEVSNQGSWIVVFDDHGKEIRRMGGSNKEVVGVASDFFVVIEGSWIVTYDENCKEIKRMGSANKSVHSASGRTFTTQEGSWIVTYDRNCKEQGRRSK
jgi:predicted small secreted protein